MKNKIVLICLMCSPSVYSGSYVFAGENNGTDIITHPEITCTLHEAREKGCKIHKGIAMLEGQIELMNDFMK